MRAFITVKSKLYRKVALPSLCAAPLFALLSFLTPGLLANSIDKLLEDADAALLEKDTPPAKKPDRPKKPAQTKTSLRPAKETKETQSAQPQLSKPLDDPSLANILRAERHARSREEALGAARFSGHFSFGAAQTQSYELSKDDDRFLVEAGQWQPGVGLSFVPLHVLHSTQPRLPAIDLVMSLGAFHADVVTKRSGVVTDVRRYQHSRFHGDLLLQFAWSFARRWQASVAWGAGFDGVMQDGDGELDTVFDGSTSEVSVLSLVRELGEPYKILFSIAQRGRGVSGLGDFPTRVYALGVGIDLGRAAPRQKAL